jgi:hypothetical protein
MPNFELLLKYEKARTYTIISWLIIALNFISFTYLGIAGLAENITYPFVAAGLIFFCFLLRNTSRLKKREDLLVSFSFCVIIVSWIVLQFYWAATINLVLFIFQDITRRKLVVLFFEDRIIYPSFPRRTIQWPELNNVILKDGLLTIDLKNDKVFQHEIASAADENELNQFCKEHIQPPVKN